MKTIILIITFLLLTSCKDNKIDWKSEKAEIISLGADQIIEHPNSRYATIIFRYSNGQIKASYCIDTITGKTDSHIVF